MVRWKCSTNSKYNVSKSSFSPTKCFIQQVSSHPYSIMQINILYVYICIYSVDTHPVSAILSSQLSTRRFNTSVPIQLTFNTDMVKLTGVEIY